MEVYEGALVLQDEFHALAIKLLSKSIDFRLKRLP